MLTTQEVLSFWLDEVGPKGWYAGGEDLDQQVRDYAEATWDAAMNGACAFWLTHPSGVLAYSILMDQLPRNMFRGSGKAFASDLHARAAVKGAIERRWDQRIDAPARQFFFMPLMHSENVTDQERSIRRTVALCLLCYLSGSYPACKRLRVKRLLRVHFTAQEHLAR